MRNSDAFRDHLAESKSGNILNIAGLNSPKLRLDGVPCRAVNQGRMLARIPNAFVLDFANIKRVRQNLVEVTARKGQTADRSTAGRRIWFGREIKANELGLDPLHVL